MPVGTNAPFSMLDRKSQNSLSLY